MTPVDIELSLAALKGRVAELEAQLQHERDRHSSVEEQLRRSQEQYRQLIEAMSEVIYAADAQGTLTYVSPAIEAMLGYRPDELVGRLVTGFIHPDDRTEAVRRMRRVLDGRTLASQYRVLTRSGDIRWVRTSSKPIMAADRVVGVQGMVADITEQQTARQQIQQQNEFLTSILEALSHPFYVVDAQDFTVQLANPAAQEAGLWGSGTCYSLSHGLCEPCSERGQLCPVKEIKRTGRPVSVEHIHYQPDGTERYVEVRGYPLYDDQGNVARIIEYTLDITSRRQAELALRKSEALLKETQRLARLGGWELDLVTGQLTWTEGIHAIYELPPDFKPTLETALSFYDPRDRPALERAIQQAIETGKPWDLELRLRTGTGQLRWVNTVGKAEWLDGRVVRLSGTAQDVTERRLTANALRKAQEVAQRARSEENARRQEAERRRDIAERLAEVMAALNSREPLERTLAYIASQASRLLGCDSVAIYRLDPSSAGFVQETAQGVSGDQAPDLSMPVVQEILRQAVAEHQAVQVTGLTQVGTEPRLPAAGGAGDQVQTGIDPESPAVATLTAVPIVVRDEVYGAMLLHLVETRTILPEELDIAAAFTNQVALAVENAQLQQQAREAAVTDERQRLARELHDSVTQNLFSASLVAEVLPQVWNRDPEQAMEGLDKLRHLTRGALAEMRTMLLELRPAALQGSKLQDLVRQLIDGVTGRAELAVVSDLDPIPSLPPQVHITFYRIAQEALQNAVKHSHAGQVSVCLEVSPLGVPNPGVDPPVQVRLQVSDDGVGFEPGAPQRTGLGLHIMSERAEGIGAGLVVASSPGQGTQVTLTWPDMQEDLPGPGHERPEVGGKA